MVDAFGNYTFMDGMLAETPEELLQEVKELIEMRVKDDAAAQGVNISSYDGEHVIHQRYRDDKYNTWSEPLLGMEIPCIIIAFKMTRKVSA